MYRKIIVSLLALGLLFPLSAQNFSFPESNALWTSSQETGCIGGSIVYGIWKDFLGGDTILQAKTYKKVYHKPTCTITTAGTHCPYSYIAHNNPPVLIGALRVDGAKVYFVKFINPLGQSPHLYNTPADMEILMYDFNLQINDTITIPTLNHSNHAFKVEGITTMANGRKQFLLRHLGNGYTETIWEGAGNTTGLFAHLSSYFYYNLPTCLTINGESIMYYLVCDYCLPVGTEEPLNPQLSVFPNPALDELTVQLSGEVNITTIRYHLKLFDIQGRLLWEKPDFVPGTTLSVGQWAALRSVVLVLQDLDSGRSVSKWVQLGN